MRPLHVDEAMPANTGQDLACTVINIMRSLATASGGVLVAAMWERTLKHFFRGPSVSLGGVLYCIYHIVFWSVWDFSFYIMYVYVAIVMWGYGLLHMAELFMEEHNVPMVMCYLFTGTLCVLYNASVFHSISEKQSYRIAEEISVRFCAIWYH